MILLSSHHLCENSIRQRVPRPAYSLAALSCLVMVTTATTVYTQEQQGENRPRLTVLLYDHRYRPPKPAEQPEGELVAAFWSDGYVILRPAGTDKLQRGTIEPTAVDELLRRLKDVGFWGTELTRSVNSPPYEISITVFASGNPRTLHWDRVPNADKAPPACRQEQMEVVRVFPLAEKVIASCVPAAQLSAPDDKRLNEGGYYSIDQKPNYNDTRYWYS